MGKLFMLQAPSASGKTTWAKQKLKDDGNSIRINRDDLRAMALLKWNPKKEGWIIDSEITMAREAAIHKYNIIIDDTNLTKADEVRWSTVAKELGYTFEKVKLDVSLEECLKRDSTRGTAKVGRDVIERQFLKGKLWKIPDGRKTVIFDIDGTLADLQHRVGWVRVGGPCPNCVPNEFAFGSEQKVENGPFTCPWCYGTKVLPKKDHDMFYSLVALDKPIEAVIKWIQACYETYHVVIVTGRSPEKSMECTIEWLKLHSAPYHHILMRRPNVHGDDWLEKQLILEMILQVVPKEDIAFVVDDRPSVIDMWKRNGLRVFPVRGRDDDKFYEIGGDSEVDSVINMKDA